MLIALHAAAVHRAAVHVAGRDTLTGLDTRAGFHTALADGTDRPVTVIVVNLDGSRVFVAGFGDRALDQLLVLTAARVQHLASAAHGAVFRLRRDEFAVVLNDPAGGADHTSRLLASVAEPTEILLSGRSVTAAITACAGVASSTPRADRGPRLALVRADHAMRAAKQAGRGHTAIFGPAMMRGFDGPPASHTEGRRGR
ncbi:diguanylate cyclase domain-containing protein [Dactylosporangium sp. CA-092794]|uniref:diguanylate cyclase domain-containing protein n=1 Tax=Dactylosporangium sp. CA-092794 TaxID=3239929 RepID=UPI003D8A1E1E